MALELIYTSVPKGLQPGSSGFCTVACTQGMDASLIDLLESLSGYRPLYPAHDAQREKQNPVAYSHYRFFIKDRAYSILSRISSYGVDYTKRTNKLAHHVVIRDEEEKASGGPAWVLNQKGIMTEEWSGEPRWFDHQKKIPQGEAKAKPAKLWEKYTGDAGWAGVLLHSFVENPHTPAYLVYEPGIDLLALFQEALALLPPEVRWQVTFNTYFTTLPQGTSCHWRGCLKGSSTVESIRHGEGACVIDFTHPMGKVAEDHEFIHQARTGKLIEAGALKKEKESVKERVVRKEGSAISLQRPAPSKKASVQTAYPSSPPPLLKEQERGDGRATTGSSFYRWAFYIMAPILLLSLGGNALWVLHKTDNWLDQSAVIGEVKEKNNQYRQEISEKKGKLIKLEGEKRESENKYKNLKELNSLKVENEKLEKGIRGPNTEEKKRSPKNQPPTLPIKNKESEKKNAPDKNPPEAETIYRFEGNLAEHLSEIEKRYEIKEKGILPECDVTYDPPVSSIQGWSSKEEGKILQCKNTFEGDMDCLNVQCKKDKLVISKAKDQVKEVQIEPFLKKIEKIVVSTQNRKMVLFTQSLQKEVTLLPSWDGEKQEYSINDYISDDDLKEAVSKKQASVRIIGGDKSKDKLYKISFPSKDSVMTIRLNSENIKAKCYEQALQELGEKEACTDSKSCAELFSKYKEKLEEVIQEGVLKPDQEKDKKEKITPQEMMDKIKDVTKDFKPIFNLFKNFSEAYGKAHQEILEGINDEIVKNVKIQVQMEGHTVQEFRFKKNHD